MERVFINSSKQRKAGAILSYFNIILGAIIGIVYTPFLLKMLGQSEYGLYSLILALMSFLAILDLGFGSSIVRFNAKFRAVNDYTGVIKLNGLFVILYSVMALVSLCIGYVLYNNFESFIGNSLSVEEINKAKIMFVILILNLAFTLCMSIYNALLIAHEKFILVNSLALFRTLTMPLVMIPLLLLGYDSIALVVVSVLLNVIALIVAAIYCYWRIKIKISFKDIDFGLFKDISTYSFFILLNILVDKLYAPTSQYILGITTGTAAVAVYAIGIQLTTYFASLSTSINSVFLPRITNLVTNNKTKEISDIFIRIGRLQFLILVFVLSGFIVFGREFISLWAGDEYINSYYIALIIMVPSIIPLSQNLAIVILQARNQLKFRVLTYLIIAMLSVILSYYLSQLYLEIGPAISVAIATIIGQILIMNIYYNRKIQLNIIGYWKEIIPISMKILIFGLGMGILKECLIINNSWITLGFSVGAYSIICFLYMYLLIFNTYEKSLIKSIYFIFKNKLKRF